MRCHSRGVLERIILQGVEMMKPGWWVAGIVAAVAVGGTLWYLRRLWGDASGALHFVDEESALKNFGAFPPEMPEDEFDGVNFLF
jgi:hypothetical protein